MNLLPHPAALGRVLLPLLLLCNLPIALQATDDPIPDSIGLKSQPAFTLPPSPPKPSPKALAHPAPRTPAPTPNLPRPVVVEILLQDTLQDSSAQSFAADLRAANDLHPAAILLNLSTPGGNAASAARMAAAILQSFAPVLVFVREQDAHVAGEGLRLLQAGDARAMHPQAMLLLQVHPCRYCSAPAETLETILRTATQQSRHAKLRLEDPAFNLPRLTSTQALQSGLIDDVANTEAHLLEHLDGRAIQRPNGTTTRLALHDARVLLVPMTYREHALRALMNPNLAVLLLTLGGLLIYLEINTPGGVIPGAAGVLLVLLAVFGLHNLPLRWEGLLLLALASIALLAEAHFQRGPMLAIGAMVAFVLGLKLLVRGPIPELEINWGTAIGAGVGFGGITAGLLLLGMKARRAKIRTGADAMLGWFAVTQTPLKPEGEILVRGELWRARLSGDDAFLPAGECVKVQSAEGTVLQVAPLPLQTAGASR